MAILTQAEAPRQRLSRLDVKSLEPMPRLVVNPQAGHKLGMSTNAATLSTVTSALTEAGLRFEVFQTQYPRHATQLAREAAQAGCKLIIAAGGDGTVAETGEGIVNTQTALGIMPLGSIMNMARTLCIPRDLTQAARVIAQGHVLAMDVGRVHGHSFLEAGGVGLTAGLLAYFDRLDSGARPQGVLRGVWRFLSRLGTPTLLIDADGQQFSARASMVSVGNGPFVGAAYGLAPDARVDDGLLDVSVFRELPVWRVLLHLALVAGGRRLPPPPEAQTFRARRIRIATRRRRPLPVHADGSAVGGTPAEFKVLPAALRVVVGVPDQGAVCAWETAGSSR